MTKGLDGVYQIASLTISYIDWQILAAKNDI